MTLPGLFLAAAVAIAPPPRFFIAGDAQLTILNAHTDERVQAQYRGPDRRYDQATLRRISHVFRSRGDDREIPVSLRLIEILSRLQRLTGLKPLVLLSGYRSTDYNQELKQRGGQVAGGSMHTEGLAADLAFPRPELPAMWQKVRALDCCGAGMYRQEGFMHVDVGRPRFWEPSTSRVDENLSAGNARLLARTEFDRYAAGETIVVSVHALTVPPVLIERRARLVPERGESVRVALAGDLPERDGCFELAVSRAQLRVPGAPAVHGRAKLVLTTCTPRLERTPETLETNPIEIL